MARTELNAKLDEIRQLRNEVLAQLQDVDDTAAALSTEQWSSYPTVSVLFLRFGDHMREHANQLTGARQALQVQATDIQRKLAEAEQAWGHLLGTVVGLTDADLDRVPAEGSWTVREILDHILMAESRYLQSIQAALAAQEQNERS